jgi:hypothetical protein
MNTAGGSFRSSFTGLLFFTVLLFGLACFSGSLFSGYHIIDDHEIISIHNDFKSHESFLSVAKRELVNDFSIRFRPLYYIDRVTTILVFGDNFFLWSLYRTLIAVFTAFVLFLFARNFGMGLRESLVFPCISMLGTQSSVWFSRGPAEAPAMLLFAFSLYCISLTRKQSRVFRNLAFAASCVAMSLTKENFALTVPFLCALLIYVDMSRSGLPWTACVKMRWGVYAFLVCFLASEFAVIMFAVGTNRIDYAGLQPNPLKYAVVFLEFVFYNGEGIVCAACMFLFARFYKSSFAKSLFPVLVFLALIAMQSLIYSKSGLLASRGRYVLPSSAAFGFVTCLLLAFFKNNPKELSARGNLYLKLFLLFCAFSVAGFNILVLSSGHFSHVIMSGIAHLKGHPAYGHWPATIHSFSLRFAAVSAIACIVFVFSFKSRQIHSVAGSIIFIMLCYCAASAYGAGREFAKEGRNIAKCMDAIGRGGMDSSLIVIVADPSYNVEDIFSVTRYLTIKAGKKNLGYWFLNPCSSGRIPVKQWEDTTLAHFGAKSIRSQAILDSARCLFFLKESEQPFFASSGFNIQKDFTRNEWGNLVCYFHK